MTAENRDSEEQNFARLLGGKWITAAISAAAQLGIADEIGDGAVELKTLAVALQCDETSLKRLLGVLSGEALVTQSVHGEYELTPLGQQLRAENLGSIARYVGESHIWNPWSRLAESVKSGSCAFEDEHGVGLFDYLDQNPNAAATYHAGVDAFTKRQARALTSVFDFAERRSVLDIGGGRGTLLYELLLSEPHLCGTLVDLEPALRHARPGFAELEREGRAHLREQSFFDELPADHDVLVLKHVLHNWDDEHAHQILENCRRAMVTGGVLLVVESFVLPGNRPDAARMMDLEMMVLFGGARERSKPDFRKLLHDAGFRLEVSADLAGVARLLVCHAR